MPENAPFTAVLKFAAEEVGGSSAFTPARSCRRLCALWCGDVEVHVRVRGAKSVLSALSSDASLLPSTIGPAARSVIWCVGASPLQICILGEAGLLFTWATGLVC